MPRSALGRKSCNVSDTVAEHGHAVGMQLSHEDRCVGVGGGRLDKDVRPINLEVAPERRVHLEPHQAHVARSVALVHGPIEHILNQPKMVGQQFFCARHEATAGIGGLIPVVPNHFGQRS